MSNIDPELIVRINELAKKKKDGTFNKMESTISIAYPFCPFCGKKLSEEK